MFHDPDFTPFTPNERPTWRSTKRNYLENWPPAAYREDYFTLNRVWPFVQRTHYLADPELIEDMLITRAESFTRDFITVGALSSMINQDALFFVEGADWKWQRRALAPAFRHENLLALTPTFVDCAKAQAEAWRRSPQDAPIDAMNAMSNVTFAVIERAVLGVTGAFDRGKFVAALQESFAGMSWQRIFTLLRLPVWLPFPGSSKINRNMRYLYDETARLLAARRASGVETQAIIDRLLAAKDPESGRSMTDAELIANLYGFLVAGHETSAVALGWSLWLLAKDQASQERVRDEARAIADNSDISGDAIEKLQFTKQAIQESMRLFPPAAAIGRQPREDMMLGSHKISKNEPVFAALWALHRHEKLWDAPNAFDPDRFAPEKSKTRHRCAYMPFGAGPRICIGMGFAMLEMTAILATLVQDFRFAPVEGYRLELAPDFTTRPSQRRPAAPYSAALTAPLGRSTDAAPGRGWRLGGVVCRHWRSPPQNDRNFLSNSTFFTFRKASDGTLSSAKTCSGFTLDYSLGPATDHGGSKIMIMDDGIADSGESNEGALLGLASGGLSRRSFLVGSAAGLGAAGLAGCVSDDMGRAEATKFYAAVPNEKYPIPAVDIGKLHPKYFRKTVRYETKEAPGTIIVDPANYYVYRIEGDGNATRYGANVSRPGFLWSGEVYVGRKAEWPVWTPPKEMMARQPEARKYAGGMPGGLENPLGARVLYLYKNGAYTVYTIYSTSDPETIGSGITSGCTGLLSQDMLDLYSRTPIKTKVIMLPA